MKLRLFILCLPIIATVWVALTTCMIFPNIQYNDFSKISIMIPMVAIIPLFLALLKSAMIPSDYLPEKPLNSLIKRFGVPLIVEIFKMLMLFCANKMACSFSILHDAFIVGAVYALMAIIAAVVTNAPYDMFVYSRFYNLLSIWKDCRHSRGHNPPKSLEDSSSEETMFNLNSFEPKSIHHSQSLPIMASTSTDNVSLLDRYYCVSPKNTLHWAHDISVNSINSENDCLSPGGVDSEIGIDATNEPMETNPLVFPNTTSDSPSVYEEPKDAPEKPLIRMLRWFAWLLPISPRKNSPPQLESHHQSLLKKKLSTYTMKSDNSSIHSFSSSRNSRYSNYGATDLENQRFFSKQYQRQNVHLFYDFAKFSNHSLDKWVSLLARVDPMFRKFGVTIPEFPILFFVAYCLEIALAQFVSFLVLAFPVVKHLCIWKSLLLYLGHVVVQLFCCNYLRLQCSASFSVTIISALAIRAFSFAALLRLYCM